MIRTYLFALARIITVSSMVLAQDSNTTASDTAAELRKLDHTVLDAEKNLDVAALEQFFAPSYVLILPNGVIYTKEAWLRLLKSPDHPVIEVADPRDIQVHLYGKTAILIDTTTVKSHDHEGRDSSGTFRVLRVMLRQHGKWRVAAVELTPLS